MRVGEDETREVGWEAGTPESGEPPRERGRARVVLVAILVLAGVAAIVIAGILPRLRARDAVRAETNDLAVPSVFVAHPRSSAASQEVVLPANIQPYISAPIFARTNGYLKRWDFDIGSRVKKGQLLAEIATPEIDAQLRQAQADLATAQANLHLAEITAARYQELLKSDSVSKQETDNATSDLAAKQTTLKSARENVQRLNELQSFEKVVAPFDGVVTQRGTDIGQLINSGSSGGPSTELFQVAAIDPLRVYVSVPQIYSPVARRGLSVDLTLPQFPGRRFVGTLVRTADAIDPASRTLLVEIDVRNPSGELLPGAYAETHFKLAAGQSYLVPVPALIFRSAGLQVATVDDGQHAVLKNIQLGRDFGTEVEVISGLTDKDVVVLNPPDSLVNDEVVHPVPAPENAQPQPPRGQP
jgi:RND family efflux transporter MFP subunit